MKTVVIYIHGKGGSAEEAEHYRPLFPDCDVIGFDYKSRTPWEAKEEFPTFTADSFFPSRRVGFTPGFTYLGGMSAKLETPRLKQPRVKIPAGSVGIAGKQTGVYPIDSPGGWQLIGRTPVKMYDPNRETPILPKAGQYIKFRAIERTEYDEIAAAAEKNEYVCRTYPRGEEKT